MDKRHIYDPDHDRRHSKAERARLSAAFALWVEALIKHLWSPASWAAALAAIMLLSLPSLFGNIGWMITGAAFWIGTFYLLIEDFKHFKAPSRNAVLKRVQKDSQLDYRPLEVLSDSPAGLFTSAKRKLWNRALQKAESDTAKIRPSFPTLCASLWDRQGLRLMALIAFVAGLMIAGGQSHDRLMRGLFPFGGLGSNEGLSYTIWINPPDYTGMGDRVLDSASLTQRDAPLIIPEGSVIKSTVKGLWGPAWLKLDAEAAPESAATRFTHTDNDSFAAELSVPDLGMRASEMLALQGENTEDTISYDAAQGRLALRNLIRHFAAYDITYRPDYDPFIDWQDDSAPENQGDDTDAGRNEQEPPAQPDPFMELPAKTTTGSERDHGMIFPVIMRDDYGVQNIELVIALSPEVEDKPLYEGENTFIKPINTAPQRDYRTQSFFDLSDHPWAGLPVTIRLRAVDEAGQKAATEPRHYTIRERDFSQKLAQRLVYLRKKLIWDGHEAAETVAFDLRFQLQYPEDMREDPSIWLALKNAMQRLERAQKNEDVFPVIDMLWDIALDLEDMGLSKAARDLDRATSKITRAMRRDNIENEEILDLFGQYRESMSQYLDKLREFNENRDLEGSDIPQEIMRDLLDPRPLTEMLNQMEDLANEGDYESLEDMIADLQALLESFALGGGMPPDLEAMEKGLNVLQGLIDSQKRLLQDTEELATLVPDSAKMPQKGFGEQLEPDQRIIEQWNQGDMPPAPMIGEMPVPMPGLRLNEDGYPISPLDEAPAPQQDAFKDDSIVDDSLPETQREEDIQEVLRFILGELMGELYEFTNQIPETMPLAELEMRKSTRTLDNSRPDESVPIQEEVIRLLEQAQQDLQDQMQQSMQQRTGMRFQPRSTDPLGRPTEPENDVYSEDSDVEVPESFERRRIDEILEYLRKHAGDPDRPKVERDYFRRLLKQFN